MFVCRNMHRTGNGFIASKHGGQRQMVLRYLLKRTNECSLEKHSRIHTVRVGVNYYFPDRQPILSKHTRLYILIILIICHAIMLSFFSTLTIESSHDRLASFLLFTSWSLALVRAEAFSIGSVIPTSSKEFQKKKN